ncbi:type II secretion system ATPase GspE [bacterium]|nr:type II secretion system ATPase GspE [candidate division CSSED10-310 bacterium]
MEDLEVARKQSERTGKTIHEILLEFGLLSTRKYAENVSSFFKVPFLDLSEVDVSMVQELPLSVKFIRQNQILPLEMTSNVMKIAVKDPLKINVYDSLRLILNREMELVIADATEIDRRIEELYGSGTSSMKMILNDMEEEDLEILGKEEDQDVDTLRDMASEAPVIKLVNLLFSQAVEVGASDIHIEPFEGDLKIRYRIDGVLHDQEAPPKRFQAAIISRIKILSGLNIAEHRLPQDGRIRLRIMGQKIDVRVSTVPTLHGESVVMRLLDQSSMFIELESLGFPQSHLKIFQQLIHHPHGMILVTGPTGSGKTTTLYAALDKINQPDKKIITVEDPVEYQLKGVNQIQVNTKIGLSFASGLRHIVRQDPDVIMVGEIRDFETAEIAVQSALTGHLVFSTVHTNDAPGAVTRLQDMGVENYLIASCLDGVLAQRLVRTICPDCKEPTRVDQNALAEMEIENGNAEDAVVYQGVGCRKCSNTGYRGRMGIYELFVISDHLRNLILEKSSANVLKREARKLGMKTLREDGWNKVKQGVTTIEEVMRVTQEEEII